MRDEFEYVDLLNEAKKHRMLVMIVRKQEEIHVDDVVSGNNHYVAYQSYNHPENWKTNLKNRTILQFKTF